MTDQSATPYERMTKFIKEELADCSCEAIAAITTLTAVKHAARIYPNSQPAAQDHICNLVNQGFDILEKTQKTTKPDLKVVK